MKSIFLELIAVDPGLDKLAAEIKKTHQITPDMNVIERIKKETFENRAAGKSYKIFENAFWLITGMMDDEDEQSIWIEISKKE